MEVELADRAEDLKDYAKQYAVFTGSLHFSNARRVVRALGLSADYYYQAWRVLREVCDALEAPAEVAATARNVIMRAKEARVRVGPHELLALAACKHAADLHGYAIVTPRALEAIAEGKGWRADRGSIFRAVKNLARHGVIDARKPLATAKDKAKAVAARILSAHGAPQWCYQTAYDIVDQIYRYVTPTPENAGTAAAYITARLAGLPVSQEAIKRMVPRTSFKLPRMLGIEVEL